MLQDKLLVWKLRQGDKDALERIYEKYRDDLLRIAGGLLIEKSKAEDAVHDVFANFVSICSSFKLTGSLKGYLVTCVANKARNLNRSAARQKVIEIDQIDPTDSNHKRPDRWIIYDEQFQKVCDTLTQLPYEQREAVVLHIQGGKKFKEIALLQQTSVKTALSRYRYGIEKLRSLLSEVTK